MKRERIGKAELEAVRRIYRGGISIEIMAAEIGVAVNTIYRWLNGSRNPGYLVTEKIRRFLRKHTIHG
jgi:transposase